MGRFDFYRVCVCDRSNLLCGYLVLWESSNAAKLRLPSLTKKRWYACAVTPYAREKNALVGHLLGFMVLINRLVGRHGAHCPLMVVMLVTVTLKVVVWWWPLTAKTPPSNLNINSLPSDSDGSEIHVEIQPLPPAGRPEAQQATKMK